MLLQNSTYSNQVSLVTSETSAKNQNEVWHTNTALFRLADYVHSRDIRHEPRRTHKKEENKNKSRVPPQRLKEVWRPFVFTLFFYICRFVVVSRNSLGIYRHHTSYALFLAQYRPCHFLSHSKGEFRMGSGIWRENLLDLTTPF